MNPKLLQQGVTKTTATLEAEAYSAAQSIIKNSDAMKQLEQFESMFSKFQSVTDKMQQFRKGDRILILKHSLKDTMDTTGTAIAIALDAKTTIDKGMNAKMAKELGKKVLQAVR